MKTNVDATVMKAIAVLPGKPNSVHLATLARPAISDVANGCGVLVKVIRVGVDGTDREINAAQYGAAPDGYDFLVIGHEGFGQVEAVGPNVSFLRPGDFVVATVRRPGGSLYDVIGLQDMTTDTEYLERGINLRHGYLTEYYVEDEAYIVKIPQGLRRVGVLLEPMSVAQKGISQAYEIQRRLKVWRPRRAAVMGTGTLGLLAALTLRLRGIDVTAFGLSPAPYLNADLLAAIGARYVSTREQTIAETAADAGAFDLIFEGTGSSAVVFESMQALAKNGALVLTSITGGSRRLEVPADRINLDFVLGNKVMLGSVNASRDNFESGVRDMSQAEAEHPGWLARLLTDSIPGLDNYRALFDRLENPNGAIKIVCEVG